MHVVFVSTVLERAHLQKSDPRKANILDFAAFPPGALLRAMAVEQDVLGCRPFGDPIDSELGDLQGSGPLNTDDQNFSYIRYNKTVNSDVTAHHLRNVRATCTSTRSRQ